MLGYEYFYHRDKELCFCFNTSSEEHWSVENGTV